ncbi:MAG: transcriptional regulator [Solirubrobacteraceae bacterium]|jgi:transcriptional regulator|nr:transcriptional regulator [Solirubrobacteraceae bacterium]
MFVPAWQREPDEARLWAVVERESFAQLICCDDHGAPSCTLMPFIRRERRLWTHFAVANPQMDLVADGRPVLCQFLGPDAYVSPAWYVQPGDVPTWNFVQVAVTGRLAAADRERSRWILKETVREHEGHRESPCPFERMEAQVDKLQDGIRGFEVLVETIEGRFKLSQNRSGEDRHAVIAALDEGSETDRQVADLMTDELTRSPPSG